MAGKSTYMRQTAVIAYNGTYWIVLLPARDMLIYHLFDRYFY